MAWPKRRRLLRPPFFAGLALLATLLATALLHGRPRILDAGPVGASLLVLAVALAPTLLTWGLWRLARKGGPRVLVWLAGAALAVAATFADRIADVG
jgi:hypothetical protein